MSLADYELTGRLKKSGGHDSECETELTSHGYTPCRCDERRDSHGANVSAPMQFDGTQQSIGKGLTAGETAQRYFPAVEERVDEALERGAEHFPTGEAHYAELCALEEKWMNRFASARVENERLRKEIHEVMLENMNLRNELKELKGDPTDLNALLKERKA